jgi:hypothetical protein
MSRRSLFLAPLLVLLVGCDQLGIESASATAARREAEGKAVGAACRHAGRAIEDCFALNRRTDKAAIYAGWREMDDYMRENKIQAVAPVMQPPTHKAGADDTADADAAKTAQADKPAAGEKADRVAARDDSADKADKADKATSTR